MRGQRHGAGPRGAARGSQAAWRWRSASSSPRRSSCRSARCAPATLFGEGQIERIATACEQDEAELVIVDGALSAIQQRNLEEKLKRKVIDRTGLILEIFGERAATAEGRLQVELAHLDYQQSRLVRSWTHLERQRGGFGFLGGPGETQIEADRRMIRDRMGKLRRELEQVRRTRALHRERRGQGAVAGDRAGRLHQRRQVDAVQPPDRRRRDGGGPAVRHARSDHARDRAARGRQGDPVRHGRASSPTCRPSWSPRSARRWRK